MDWDQYHLSVICYKAIWETGATCCLHLITFCLSITYIDSLPQRWRILCLRAGNAELHHVVVLSKVVQWSSSQRQWTDNEPIKSADSCSSGTGRLHRGTSRGGDRRSYVITVPPTGAVSEESPFNTPMIQSYGWGRSHRVGGGDGRRVATCRGNDEKGRGRKRRLWIGVQRSPVSVLVLVLTQLSCTSGQDSVSSAEVPCKRPNRK